MNRLLNSATVLALAYLTLVVVLMSTANELPDRVATHFDFSGEPNDWMSRPSYLLVVISFGLLFPLALPAALTALHWLPTSFINVPNREYWLAPERLAETQSYLVRHALWLSSLEVGLVIALHLLTVDANRQNPPRLASGIWLIVLLFLVGVGVWIGTLVWHLTRGPALDDDV
jgi:uncharacterized membrane protein